MPRSQIDPEPRSSARLGARGLARWLGLLVLLTASAAYLPALWQGFVLGDDNYNFVQNDRWHGLGLEQLGWMWTTFHYGHWHPLTWMSFGLEYVLWGGVSAEGMHATNLVLHALNALLVFLLLRRLLAAGLGERAGARAEALVWAAALGALVWAVHPLRVESVVWATERRDLLSGLFLIATVLAWVRWVAGDGRAWLAAALGLYALSLMSKAWGITLPALLLVLDVYPLRRLGPAGGGLRGLLRLALEKWPFVPLAAGTAWLAALAQSHSLATLSLAEHGLTARFAQAAYGLVFYPWKTLAPGGLSTLYALESDLDPTRAVYLASAACVLLVTAIAWVQRGRWPALLASWVAYGVIVSPVLGILQSGAQKVADRYTYLAAIPLSALLAAVLQGLLAVPRRRRVVVSGAAVVLLALGVASWRRSLVWKDSVTLWRDAVEVEPESYVSQLNLAAALRIEGRLEEARESALASIAAEPGPRNVNARLFVGVTWLDQGDFERALQAWREALAVDPTDFQTLSIVSQELGQRGRSGEALELLRAGHAADPEDLEVAGLLASALWAAGDPGAAEQVWRRGLAVDATWVDGHVGAARALLGRRQLEGAELELRVAREHGPRRIDVLVLLGRVLRARGRVQEAEACWSEALELDPRQTEAETLLRQSREAASRGH